MICNNHEFSESGPLSYRTSKTLTSLSSVKNWALFGKAITMKQ